jgi:hypothetical protein
MGRPRTTESLVCPVCQVDFALRPFGTSAFKKHKARRNPCVRPPDVKYKRAPAGFLKGIKRNNFDELSLGHVVGPTAQARPEAWIRAMLHQVFAIDENKSIVLKNLEFPDEIYIRRRDRLELITLHKLTILTLLMMHERLFPFLHLKNWEKYSTFEEWVAESSGVHLGDRNWGGTIEPLSYYYIAVRDFLRKYLADNKHRRHDLFVLMSSTIKE